MGHGKGRGSFSGYTCVKYMFFIFNVIFWLIGCALLGVGIWLHLSKGAYASMAPSFNFLSVTAVCIAAGAVMLVVAFFGCCGAIMENQCLLLTYFTFVVLIFVMEMVAGILAFVYREDIQKGISGELKKGISDNYGSEEGLTAAWDTVQQELMCCGVSNYTDWYQVKNWPTEDYVPDSCCTFITEGCGADHEPHRWYDKGCYAEIKYQFNDNLYIVGVVGLTFGVLQILGLVASMALFCFLRSEKYEDYYT